jgi:cytidyltransferase-like protein
MQIYKNIHQLPLFDLPCSMTLGCFDGLHRGHLHLISELKKKGPLSALVTFDSPLPMKSPLSIFSSEQKTHLLGMLDIDILLLLSFEEIASLPYDRFLDELLNHFPFLHLVLGKGSLFGKNQEGTEKNLLSYAKNSKVQVDYLPPIFEGAEMICSTTLREAILEGNLDHLQKLLGRPFSYTFFPPFPPPVFSSPYSSHLSLEFSLKTFVCLPSATYEVSVESSQKIFTSKAALQKDRLTLILPASHFSKENPLTLSFLSKEKKSFFSPQNLSNKALYV